MATQSLYRRFRPRKFSELYGQEHVVRALRNAVVNGREGQAYLFSGPRGTGKTTTARILAKVLNCENPVDGEPCCQCPSCSAVELGTSYDVLELDAASNNGVNEIRDIIETAALTSPGRHRVFILDEVHMLSPGARAALLKTLEEPPEQVVFVLATTDPQKVPDTIRSRVQHLQFHLLPLDELEKYVRFVIAEAGLEVDDTAIESVLRKGGGSARDTLSALELEIVGAGLADDDKWVDNLVSAIIARDHGSALAVIADVSKQGRDARTLADDIVRTMRDCFLTLMAPALVLAPEARREELSEFARELGPQRIVKIMETVGTTMVEMRHAPDARLLLEVSIVQLASPAFDDSMDNLLARIQQLEEAVKALRESGVAAARPAAPVNPSTGRAVIGGLASAGSTTAPIGRPADLTGGTPSPRRTENPAPVASTAGSADASAPADGTSDGSADVTPVPTSPAPTAASPGDVPSGVDPAQAWPQIVDSLKGMAKALFKPAVVESVDGSVVTVRMPSNTPMARVKDYTKPLVEAISAMCGGKYSVTFVQSDPTSPGGIPRPAAPATIVEEVANDPFAPVDPSELVDASHVDDPVLVALKQNFPGGSVQDDPTPDDGVTRGTSAGKAPRGRK